MLVLICFFFFFQAEDGIRDLIVTGVQTCALPISLAEDASLPLLARVRFLSIFRTNLDEFFMVRVAALKRALQTDDGALSDDGLTAREQLDAIVIRLRAQLERYAACWLRQCLPALGAQGIRVRGWSGLSEPERARLRDYFTEQVFPLLTPQAIRERRATPSRLWP